MDLPKLTKLDKSLLNLEDNVKIPIKIENSYDQFIKNEQNLQSEMQLMYSNIDLTIEPKFPNKYLHEYKSDNVKNLLPKKNFDVKNKIKCRWPGTDMHYYISNNSNITKSNDGYCFRHGLWLP